MTPASNEARTRLRTGLLTGSINFDSSGNATLDVKGNEDATLDSNNKVLDSRQRGTQSLD